MTTAHDWAALYRRFLADYDASAKDAVWRDLSAQFQAFWRDRILAPGTSSIGDEDCDAIVRIVDRNGKGNTKDSEAVAKAMIPQGAWRRMFNEFRSNRTLAAQVDRVLAETDPAKKAAAIDALYAMNEGQKNNLTGPSGNAVGALLAAYNPVHNLSVISLKDRRAIIEFLGIAVPFDWESATIGTRIVVTNAAMIKGLADKGLTGSAMTVSRFFYWPEVKALWKGESTVRRVDKHVSVTVPTAAPEDEEEAPVDAESVRESMQIQGLLAYIGTEMGFRIWLPRADRGRVLKVWNARPDELVDELPLGYDSTTMKTIEQIDVLWLRKRSIVRAFEVEHTTSIYSGLLRMADLVALQPNIKIALHIVAPPEKREKVLQEIKRPVFSLLEGRALSEMCTYLSYDSVREIAELKFLEHLSDKVIGDFEEAAE